MNTDCSLAALLGLKSLIRPGRSSTDDWRCLMINQTGGHSPSKKSLCQTKLEGKGTWKKNRYLNNFL